MRTALTTDCWILHLNGGYMLAISIYQVAELLNTPGRLPIPQAPAHCCHLISWRNKLIPLIDYQTHSPNAETDNIMVVKFLEENKNIQYLAFAITSVEKYTVNDDDFSTTQNQKNLPFSSSVISAFQYSRRLNGSDLDSSDLSDNVLSNSKKATYIVDMKRLYSS